ncbi:MAG: hypothetical protein KDC57_16830 [Saprospiraceae bacterium]|nr:hypothetical protein [Saprospiraceae bacterium]
MNIEEINKRHLFKTDQLYRIGFGLYSRLLDYRNGVIYLEVLFDKRWKSDYNGTAYELARCWRDNNSELGKAIGCKVFIIDARKFPYKKDLFRNKIRPEYDARKGLLFKENLLN